MATGAPPKPALPSAPADVEDGPKAKASPASATPLVDPTFTADEVDQVCMGRAVGVRGIWR